jgi:hypothetical protein
MNKMKKIIMLIIIMLIIGCNKNISKISNKQELITQELLRLSKEIMYRTKHDLKKFGIKKILLDISGIWSGGIESYHFYKNGKVLNQFKHFKNIFLWKVNNDKLFFNLNGLDSNYDNKFYEVTFCEAELNNDNIEFLKTIKYVILISVNVKITSTNKYFLYKRLLYHQYVNEIQN